MNAPKSEREAAEERLNRLFALIMACTVIGGAVALVVALTVFRD